MLCRENARDRSGEDDIKQHSCTQPGAQGGECHQTLHNGSVGVSVEDGEAGDDGIEDPQWLEEVSMAEQITLTAYKRYFTHAS